MLACHNPELQELLHWQVLHTSTTFLGLPVSPHAPPSPQQHQHPHAAAAAGLAGVLQPATASAAAATAGHLAGAAVILTRVLDVVSRNSNVLSTQLLQPQQAQAQTQQLLAGAGGGLILDSAGRLFSRSLSLPTSWHHGYPHQQLHQQQHHQQQHYDGGGSDADGCGGGSSCYSLADLSGNYTAVSAPLPQLSGMGGGCSVGGGGCSLGHYAAVSAPLPPPSGMGGCGMGGGWEPGPLLPPVLEGCGRPASASAAAAGDATAAGQLEHRPFGAFRLV